MYGVLVEVKTRYKYDEKTTPRRLSEDRFFSIVVKKGPDAVRRAPEIVEGETKLTKKVRRSEEHILEIVTRKAVILECG